MLKKSELLKRAYESEKNRLCFCVKENGEILWASEAAEAALPGLRAGEKLESALPDCFPHGFHGEQMGPVETVFFPDEQESRLFLTRFEDDEPFFLAEYETGGREDNSSEDGEEAQLSVDMLVRQVRQRTSRIFDLISEVRDQLEDYQLVHREECPLLMEELSRQLDWAAGAEKECRILMREAIQLEEFYQCFDEGPLMQTDVDGLDFFSDLLHSVKLYTVGHSLEFEYEIQLQEHDCMLYMDRHRFTLALLGMIRISCASAAACGKGGLWMTVSREGNSLLLTMRDDVSRPEDLGEGVPRRKEELTSGMSAMCCRRFRQLVEEQEGRWLLALEPGRPGYCLQVRLPVSVSFSRKLNTVTPYHLTGWPDSLSGQKGMVEIMLELENEERT